MPSFSFNFDAPIERRGTGSSKWSRYPQGVLPMWVADMDFAVAPQIVNAIAERLRHPIFGYGVAREELRERIVTHLQSAYDWKVSGEAIVMLPGVEPGFNMALRAMLQPGDGVMVQTPIYRPILNAPGHWGLTRIDVELRLTSDGSYASEPAALAEGMQRARALLLCNPHNPTGKVYTRRELEHIAELAAMGGAFIVSDEIHCDLLFDGRAHVPIASLAPEIAARTITLMSASKTYNIAGLKTAFAVVPDDALRERFMNSRLGLVDSVNVVGLEATLAALTYCGAWKQQLISYLQSNRDWLIDAVANSLPGVRIATPESTFLAWLDCSALKLGTTPHDFFLEKARVALSDGAEFGSPYGDFARLNFGCSRALLEEGITRMSRALA